MEEIDYNEKFKKYICIDETGRGNLAGEMFFCGVELKPNGNVDFADDSKKTSLKQREAMFEKLVQQVNYHIVITPADEIDKFGLSFCIKKSLEEIIDYFDNQELNEKRKYLYDGNKTFGVQNENLETLVKADAKVKLVGAASIIAKVFKDRRMLEHSKKYPEYGFETNSGYGTKEHINAIKERGYTPIHRMSYKIKELEDFNSKKKTDILF